MTSSRVNEIDLLRFLAALSVVFFHYAFRGHAADAMSVMPYPLLADVARYGYLGVELFFMISGFVILMTAAGGNLTSFAISRLVRLYPAFWACCTITFLATLWIGGERFSATLPQYLVNMTMLSGFVGVPSIDGVYWSLFVEIRFYAWVALVLMLGRIHQAQAFIAGWLLLSVAAEILHVGILRFLLITDYSAYFVAGAAYFLIWKEGASASKLAIVAGALAMAIHQSLDQLPAFEKHYGTDMNEWGVAAAVVVFFLVFLLVALRKTGFIGARRWILAGALTYPLYLLHQNLGYMIFNLAYPAVNAHLLFWGVIMLMLMGAYLVNTGIEKRYAGVMKRWLSGMAAKLPMLKAGS